MNYNKDDASYKTIGEVARKLNLIDKKTGQLQTHTIRYWETQFKQIKPKIKAGGRRYYTNDNIKRITLIKFLLKEKGLTINGVKKFLLNESSFNLDETSNISIKTTNNNLKTRLEKISNLVKEIKKLG